jgi:hypothetical protein
MTSRKRWLIAALFVVVFIACAVWIVMRSNMRWACLVSIHQGIISLKDVESKLPAEIGPEWRALSASEGDRLIFEASRLESFDCREREASGLPLDPWGNHFQCAVRRSEKNNRLEFMVWSNGSDGVAGTSDDYVSPEGQTPPASK